MVFLKKALYQRIFFSLGFLFLLALAAKSAPSILNAQSSYRYVKSSCKVLKNEFVEKSDNKKLELQYTYQFEQETYFGTEYIFGLNMFSNQNRKGANIFVNRAIPGTEHGCYVDPSNPKKSVINQGSAFETYELWTLLIFMLLSGWGFLISWFYPAIAEKFFIPADPS